MKVDIKLNPRQENILRLLHIYPGEYVTSNALKSNMPVALAGRILGQLQRLGLVESNKNHKLRVWKITDLGRSYFDKQSPAIPHLTSITGSNVPPTTPDHFVFVVSESKLASMLENRMGAQSNVISTRELRKKIEDLEWIVNDQGRQIDLLNEQLERRNEVIASISKSLSDVDAGIRSKT